MNAKQNKTSTLRLHCVLTVVLEMHVEIAVSSYYCCEYSPNQGIFRAMDAHPTSLWEALLEHIVPSGLSSVESLQSLPMAIALRLAKQTVRDFTVDFFFILSLFVLSVAGTHVVTV